MEKEFQPSPVLLFQATRAIFHSSPSRYFYYGVLLGLPLVLTFMDGVFFTINLPEYSLIFLGLFMAFIFFPAQQYISCVSSLRSNKAASQLQKYTITEAGLRNHSEGVDVNLSWNKILKVIKSKKFILFYISKNYAYYIPSGLVSEQEYKQIITWHQKAF